MALVLKAREQCGFDAVSLGEVMLRLDPGEGRLGQLLGADLSPLEAVLNFLDIQPGRIFNAHRCDLPSGLCHTGP
mgnify:CR=1 FL=1